MSNPSKPTWQTIFSTPDGSPPLPLPSVILGKLDGGLKELLYHNKHGAIKFLDDKALIPSAGTYAGPYELPAPVQQYKFIKKSLAFHPITTVAGIPIELVDEVTEEVSLEPNQCVSFYLNGEHLYGKIVNINSKVMVVIVLHGDNPEFAPALVDVSQFTLLGDYQSEYIKSTWAGMHVAFQTDKGWPLPLSSASLKQADAIIHKHLLAPKIVLGMDYAEPEKPQIEPVKLPPIKPWF